MEMRVGVIGCGAVARRAHLPAFSSLGEVELCGVVDTNEVVARRAAKKFKVKKYFTDYRDLLGDSSVELVSICTPTPLHARMVVDSAEAGKHVLVEKPLALRVEDAVSALRAVEENKVKLCVVQNYRYFPAIVAVKRSIDEGRFGRLVSVLGRANTYVPLQWTSGTWLYHEGGALDDFGPHLIDAICWLNGSSVEKVVAFGGDFLEDMGCINYVQVLMQFRNKAVAVANITWLTASLLFLDIHGTAGSVDLDLRLNHFLAYHGFLDPFKETKSVFKKLYKSVRAALSGRLFVGSLGFYKPLIRDFLKSIEGKGKIPTTGNEALQVVAISEAAKISLEQNKVVHIEDLTN